MSYNFEVFTFIHDREVTRQNAIAAYLADKDQPFTKIVFESLALQAGNPVVYLKLRFLNCSAQPVSRHQTTWQA